jgi:hypothetical protein
VRTWIVISVIFATAGLSGGADAKSSSTTSRWAAHESRTDIPWERVREFRENGQAVFTTSKSSPVTPRTRDFQLGRDPTHPFRFFIRNISDGTIRAEISRPLGGGSVVHHNGAGKAERVLTTTVGVSQFFRELEQ